MAFDLQTFAIDYRHVKSVDMRRVLAGTPAMVFYQDLAAKAVEVHAAVQEGAANAFPGPITSPATPRSVQCVFAAGWQGGDVYITGTDQFGRAQTETIADVAGTTVEGTKIWKSISAISKETVAGTTDTVTVQTGPLIGIPFPLLKAWGVGLKDGVAELFTWNATVHAFAPTTVPNGSIDYTLVIAVDWNKAYALSLPI